MELENQTDEDKSKLMNKESANENDNNDNNVDKDDNDESDDNDDNSK